MVSTTPIYPPITFPLGLRLRFLWNRWLQFAALSDDEKANSAYKVEQEFRNLIARENATISKICFSYSSSIAEFEDLRQDALINIWRGMHGFRGESSLKTWIYRVTVNSCLSTIRKQSRHQHESLEGLYGLMEKAVIMMWLDELSYDEIGAAMGLPRNTIATKIRRIKEKITNEYKREELI